MYATARMNRQHNTEGTTHTINQGELSPNVRQFFPKVITNRTQRQGCYPTGHLEKSLHVSLRFFSLPNVRTTKSVPIHPLVFRALFVHGFYYHFNNLRFNKSLLM